VAGDDRDDFGAGTAVAIPRLAFVRCAISLAASPQHSSFASTRTGSFLLVASPIG
jgi:hypothetical protein